MHAAALSSQDRLLAPTKACCGTPILPAYQGLGVVLDYLSAESAELHCARTCNDEVVLLVFAGVCAQDNALCAVVPVWNRHLVLHSNTTMQEDRQHPQ